MRHMPSSQTAIGGADRRNFVGSFDAACLLQHFLAIMQGQSKRLQRDGAGGIDMIERQPAVAATVGGDEIGDFPRPISWPFPRPGDRPKSNTNWWRCGPRRRSRYPRIRTRNCGNQITRPGRWPARTRNERRCAASKPACGGIGGVTDVAGIEQDDACIVALHKLLAHAIETVATQSLEIDRRKLLRVVAHDCSP